MMNERIYLSPPHIGSLEQRYIEEAFASNWIAPLGPNVDAFEKELAEYVGVKGVLALSSGTAAIHLALKLIGIKQGDTVFASTLTFIGSVNPVLYEGGELVFIDSEPESWNMSPLALEKALHHSKKQNKLPKAIIIVSIYGQSADWDPLIDIANTYNIPIIEDAAEALGATYKAKQSGTFGKYSVISFNGNKIVTTAGGGALLSDDMEALNKARFYATQSKDKAPYYQHSEIGYNYRLSNILAGIGRGQLAVLNERINAKRRIFDIYENELADIEGISFMPELSNGRATRWLTTLTFDQDKIGVGVSEIIEALEKENIEARYIWKPMHLQPIFKDNIYFSHGDKNSFADYLFRNGICLPSGSNLSFTDQMRVINSFKNVLPSKI